MKLKITPLLVIALAILLFGIVYIFSGAGGNLGPLDGIVALILGAISLIPYIGLRLIFPTKIAWQIGSELVLILIVAIYHYKASEKVLLCVPRNLQKDIIVVYGVDKTPPIPKEAFYSNHVKVAVPPSGVVLTSTWRAGYGNGLEFVDSLKDPVEWLKPGYGIAYIADTMEYNNKQYTLCIFSRNALNYWKLKADSVKRVLKKEISKVK